MIKPVQDLDGKSKGKTSKQHRYQDTPNHFPFPRTSSPDRCPQNPAAPAGTLTAPGTAMTTVLTGCSYQFFLLRPSHLPSCSVAIGLVWLGASSKSSCCFTQTRHIWQPSGLSFFVYTVEKHSHRWTAWSISSV